MDTKEIRRRIARLEELAAAWESEGRIEEIERDIALGLLREIYGGVRFAETAPEAGAEKAPAAEAAFCAVPQPAKAKEELPEQETAPQPEPESVSDVAETAAEAVSEQEPTPKPEAEPEPIPESEHEPEAESEPESSTVPATEPQTESEAIKATEPEPAQKPVMPRRVDPDVIRSLYGSDQAVKQAPEPVKPETPEPAPQQSAETEKTEAAKPETPADPPAPQPPAAPAGHPKTPAAKAGGNGTASAPPKTILADTVGEGRHTLGESLRNGQKDMASKIASADKKSTLKAAIGLNDRFLMIRDMFDGDARAFEEAIAVLDGFADLDEAVIHIHDTYEWNADCEGVKLLVELLERKLG